MSLLGWRLCGPLPCSPDTLPNSAANPEWPSRKVELVMVHGRYVGWAAPKPMTAVDIFRIEDGEVAEHWDVIQEEAVQTASGYQMFP